MNIYQCFFNFHDCTFKWLIRKILFNFYNYASKSKVWFSSMLKNCMKYNFHCLVWFSHLTQESYLALFRNTGFIIQFDKNENLLQFSKFPKQYILQDKLYHRSETTVLVKRSKTGHILTTVCGFQRNIPRNSYMQFLKAIWKI